MSDSANWTSDSRGGGSAPSDKSRPTEEQQARGALQSPSGEAAGQTGARGGQLGPYIIDRKRVYKERCLERSPRT